MKFACESPHSNRYTVQVEKKKLKSLPSLDESIDITFIGIGPVICQSNRYNRL